MLFSLFWVSASFDARCFLQDYKCTVEYYVSHFLVHEGKARIGQKRVQTLRIDSIDRGSSRWRGADIVVFNTAHWWSHFKTKSGCVLIILNLFLAMISMLILFDSFKLGFTFVSEQHHSLRRTCSVMQGPGLFLGCI